MATYLADLADRVDTTGRWQYAPSTIGRRLAAISKVHELAGQLPPTRNPAVTTTMSGIRRDRIRPTRRMAPLLIDDLRLMLRHVDLATFPAGVIGRRDTALLVLGFAAALRRSELTDLQGSDLVRHSKDGLHVRLRRSRTDQEGRGLIRALPFGRHPETCPPCALMRWMDALAGYTADGRVGLLRALRQHADPTEHLCREPLPAVEALLSSETPVFRPVHKAGLPGDGRLTGHAINAVVKRRAAAAGLDPSRHGGHSLRAGFVTQAVRAGADVSSIMRQTGHKSTAMVEVYRRENAPLMGNAVTQLDL